MSVKTVVTCDHCAADLTEAAGQTRYGLLLSVLPIPCRSPVQTAAYFPPPIDGEKAFCGLGCLRGYLGRGER